MKMHEEGKMIVLWVGVEAVGVTPIWVKMWKGHVYLRRSCVKRSYEVRMTLG